MKMFSLSTNCTLIFFWCGLCVVNFNLVHLVNVFVFCKFDNLSACMACPGTQNRIYVNCMHGMVCTSFSPLQMSGFCLS